VKKSEPDCGRWVTELRSRYPAEGALRLRFEDCRIAVEANRPEILSALGDYFAPFRSEEAEADIRITVHEAPALSPPLPLTPKAPDPGKSRVKEAYADLPGGRLVQKRLTGMAFLFGGGEHLCIGPCAENLNQVINFINNRFIEWKLCRGALLFHAAGVKLQTGGLALAGFSGMGKSTLALHLLSEGAVFVSNDRILAEKANGRLRMLGVAKLPRINPGTALHNPDLAGVLSEADRARFSGLPPEALWEVEQKYDVFVEKHFGPDRFVLSAPMSGLVVLNWSRTGPPPVLSPVRLPERRDLLPAFMKSTGLFFLPEAACRVLPFTPEAYLGQLEGCGVWELTGGADFPAAARLCRALMDGPA